jgi:DNA-binding NarL/FixJ family response regulator
MSLKILIVDDNRVVRAELRSLLDLTGKIMVIGEAEDGREAVHLAEALRPDIVLMDLEMPDLDGFEATRLIKTQSLARVVIVFTVYGGELNQQKAKEAGADAFIVKGTDLYAILKTFDSFFPQED